MCLEMVLRRRRLYDLVVDPAANVDVTEGEPTYMRMRIEDNRSRRQLVTAQIHTPRDGNAESNPGTPRRNDRIAISHSLGLSSKRGH